METKLLDMTMPNMAFKCVRANGRDFYANRYLHEVGATVARKYPRLVVKAHSPDRCDLDYDGLFDDEREAVQDAIDEARTITALEMGAVK